MSKRSIIVSGGELCEALTLSVLNDKQDRCVIAVDRGVEFLYYHQIMPDYIVGDFDSTKKEIRDYYKNETNVPVREYNPVKDASDTEIAIRLAMTLGSRELIILGATGGRIDHLWANIQTLTVACEAGVEAYILDERNKIWVINKSCSLKRAEAYGPYLSVFTLQGEVFDFNLKGTKWPLTYHTLKPCDSLTVSNQFDADTVEITFPAGMLVVMETKD